MRNLMALRSVLRKMPALGLRSPPMGPLMGPVRALSPAAGSRLMSSHGAPGEQTVHSEGTLAEQLESINLRRAEFGRKWAEREAESDRKWEELKMNWAEHERRTAAEFEKSTEIIRKEAAAGEAYYSEVTRRSSEEVARFMKIVHILGKTCDVLTVAFPVAAILFTISINMS